MINKTILITGGTGLVGSYLKNKLEQKGYQIKVLSTNKNKCNQKTIFYWNPDKFEIDVEALNNVDYIINLAGANIAENRWTEERKKIILESRTKSINLLFETIKINKFNIEAFISASATGYYGSVTSNNIFSETDLPATDFLGSTCKHWEESANQFNSLGIRTVILRTGIVLSLKGGALKKLLLPVKLGLGSALGSGKQIMPWIHEEDLCNMYIKAIEDNLLVGVYNAVSPNPETNYNFMKIVASVLHKPFFMPSIPSFLLKIVLGEMSTVVLDGSAVSANKIESSGFIFKYKSLKEALTYILKKDSV